MPRKIVFKEARVKGYRAQPAFRKNIFLYMRLIFEWGSNNRQSDLPSSSGGISWTDIQTGWPHWRN